MPRYAGHGGDKCGGGHWPPLCIPTRATQPWGVARRWGVLFLLSACYVHLHHVESCTAQLDLQLCSGCDPDCKSGIHMSPDGHSRAAAHRSRQLTASICLASVLSCIASSCAEAADQLLLDCARSHGCRLFDIFCVERLFFCLLSFSAARVTPDCFDSFCFTVQSCITSLCCETVDWVLLDAHAHTRFGCRCA